MKKKLICGMILLTVVMAGCGNKETKPPVTDESENTEKDAAKQPGGIEGQQESVPWSREGALLEDEQSLYAITGYKIIKINKETKETEVLWEGSEKSAYLTGKGLLYHNTIYFVEHMGAEGMYTVALSMLHTDGTGYQRITPPKGTYDFDLCVADGILYAKKYGQLLAFELGEDGTATEVDSHETAYQNTPEGMSEMSSAIAGRLYLTIPECLQRYGYLLLRDNQGGTIKIMPDTGEETEVFASSESLLLRAWNDAGFLFEDYGENKFYLVDAATLEKSFLADSVAATEIYEMDDNFLYTITTDVSESQYIFSKTELTTGENSPIFSMAAVKGLEYEQNPANFMHLTVLDGYQYYTCEKDYKRYLCRRNLETPEKEEIIGDAYYDSGISSVGTRETYREIITDTENQDITFMDINLDRLVVDERYPGADKINSLLAQEQSSMLESAYTDAEYVKEEYKDLGAVSAGYSYLSILNEIAFINDNYLSFCQNDNIYLGGAHGMPYRMGYTFDLQTGNKLGLQDILNNSEEELKDIVTEYFNQRIEKEPDAFWEDAADTVREYTTYDSAFYLTDKGIVFYFGPYELACYAAGFQVVTIPYEEFDMKISL